MVDIIKTEVKTARDIFYYRRRLKNRIFARLSSFFAEEANRTGLTKRDLALRLDKDPAQITRWLSGPSNLTLDTLSDLLLAMDAEADPPVIARFSERAAPNYVHPLIEFVTGIRISADSTPSAMSVGVMPEYGQTNNIVAPTSGNVSIPKPAVA